MDENCRSEIPSEILGRLQGAGQSRSKRTVNQQDEEQQKCRCVERKTSPDS